MGGLAAGPSSRDPGPEGWPPAASLLALVEKIPALFWATDLHLHFTLLTGAALPGARFSPMDFGGQPIASLFELSKEKNRAIAAHRQALQGLGGEFDMDLNDRDLKAHVEPIREASGTVVGVIGIALDVTDRLVAETALRLSEESYRSLVEEAPYAICRATESGQLLQVNRAMLDMLGYEHDNEADLLLQDLSAIFETPEGFRSCRKELLNDRTIQGIEANWVRQDGQKIQVRLGGRAIRNGAGDVLYFDLLAEDITERRELEARLSQAQKMQAIGQLAGGVAHDFNNLLTIIGGQAEFVLDATEDTGLRRRLQDVKGAADRAAALTRQLLAFSRRQVLQSQVVDLNGLIHHATRMLSRLIRENIAFTFYPGGNLGFVRTDPTQMEQVLMNLVVNAQDAMPQGGVLTVETANAQIGVSRSGPQGGMEPGSYVLMSVRDTGHGMDRETQARIFEPFFTTKNIGEGTGLGLAMVYGVVKQCGGYIQVESHPGQGTVFEIYLPCAEEVSTPPRESVPAASPRGSETILVTEDESAVRELVVMYLKSLGYRVLAAPDGLAALEIAREFPDSIDLLLSDLVLPKMGGRELAKTLSQSACRIKVLFISGYAGHTVAATDLDLPDAHFLAKPFSMRNLAAKIREVLDGAARPVTLGA